VDTLIAGTEEEVIEQVRVACQSAPLAGGLVLTCGNTVMVGMQYGHYRTMLRAAGMYGSRQL
jgi:hypothetical protein